MIFTVKYRGADGAPVAEAVEAASRADCLAKMNARGVAVLGVKQGSFAGNSRKNGRPLASRRNITAPIMAIVALAAILGIGIWWWCGGLGATALPEPEVPAKVSPPSAKSPRAKPRRSGVVRSFVATNRTERTASIEKPEIEHADVFFEPKVKGRLVMVSRPPGMLFTNAFENFVADIMTAAPGERFLEVELGDWFDEEFRKSLNTPIVAQPDDAADVAATKVAVEEAKKRIREHTLAGGSPRDLVLEARAELNKIADYRDKLQHDFHGLLLQEDDPEILRMYVKEANALLDEYGALPLEAPDDNEAMAALIRDYRDLDETNRAHEQAESENKDTESKGK